jgi:hypothetical protein
LKISEFLDKPWLIPAGNYDFEWDHQHTEMRRIIEAENSGISAREFPPAPLKPYCLSCYANVDIKPRLVPDWRLGPDQQFNAGTDTPHRCIQALRSTWNHYRYRNEKSGSW